MSSSPPLPPPIAGYVPEPSQDLSQIEVRRRLSPAARLGFARLIELWQTSETDARALLGQPSAAAWRSFCAVAEAPARAAQPLTGEMLTRISLLIGIFKALNILFSRELADRWVSLPNRNVLFNGRSPLQHMIAMGLPGIKETRRLLDSRRGGQ